MRVRGKERIARVHLAQGEKGGGVEGEEALRGDFYLVRIPFEKDEELEMGCFNRFALRPSYNLVF